MALLLLVVAGLLVRGFARLTGVSPGAASSPRMDKGSRGWW
jgi:hypothetical protein